jgi:hypothetical protein
MRDDYHLYIDEADEPICDHDTVFTGERDEEGRKIMKCKHCPKEFVQLYAGRKRNATNN